MTAPISTALMWYLNQLKGPDFERTLPYMYVDSVGAVTVGVGHNLKVHRDQSRLPFVVKRFERKAVLGGDRGTPIAEVSRAVNRRAMPAEIQADYDFLDKHKGLRKFDPTQLAPYTTLELSNEAIDKIFESDLRSHITIVEREFSAVAFAKFPVPCQAALIDIAFNCGGFSTFQANVVPAIKGLGTHATGTLPQRWRFVAQHCRRGQVSAARNAKVAQWFFDGAAQIEAAQAAQ